MQLLDRAWHWLRRSDVQAAGITGTALVLAVLVPGWLVYAYSASESLEEIDRWFDYVLQVVVREVEERGDGGLASLDDVRGRLPNINVAIRVHSPSGALLYERGTWPRPHHQIPALPLGGGKAKSDRGLASMGLLRRSNWVIGERVTDSGRRVELALPLRHFASESAEIRRRVLAATAVAAITVLVIGVATTIRGFAPLRGATARLREVDTGSLGVRLASRGTGDPIDLHAETLNSVLARIDAGFARLSSFSSDAAHELRTPLNRISNVTEVALLNGGESDLRAALEAVHATTEDLSRMVQALLLLAEIDERRLALRPGRIELWPWIQQHVEAYAPSFEEAGIALVAKGEPIEVVGDRVLLDRIVANLLDNALSHAPAGSSVEILVARRDDGGVAITVDDAGAGIAEADRERVFDRFARLSGAFGPGHGLGLALARAIAELHGGTLRAAVSRFGGARFELWLPHAEAGSYRVASTGEAA